MDVSIQGTWMQGDLMIKKLVGGVVTAALVLFAAWSFTGGIVPPVVNGAIAISLATVMGIATIASK